MPPAPPSLTIADLTYQRHAFARTTFSNAAYAAVNTDRLISQVGTMSAIRTVTLPKASDYAAGVEVIVADESGSVNGTNYITVARQGTDTINGATSLNINTAYGVKRFLSNGVDKWIAY